MDTHTRAVPEVVLTMIQAIRYAEKGFPFSKSEPAYHLFTMLCDLFHPHTNDTLGFLWTFYCLLPEVALVGMHIKCMDPQWLSSLNMALSTVHETEVRRKQASNA